VKKMAEDNIQHGIDDNPHNDAEKGAALGGLGGAAVGAMAGAAVGPVGAIVGAVVGGLAGAGASGAAVAAVDQVDNDNTVSGVGGGEANHIDSPSTAEVADISERFGTGTVQSTIGSADIVGHASQNSGYSDTGAAGNNAVYPSPSTGHTGVSDADVSDMNIDSANVESRDVVPNVSHAQQTTSIGNDLPGTGIGASAAGLAGIGSDVHSDRTRSADETLRVPVIEEEIHVDKHTRQAGEVSVNKHVVQEQVNVPVQVTHEEVTINRVPVDRAVQPGDRIVDEGDVIRVPVTEEVVTVDKEVRVVEEIEIRKHAVTEQEVVSDTVRREVVDVDDTTHRTSGHSTDIR